MEFPLTASVAMIITSLSLSSPPVPSLVGLWKTSHWLIDINPPSSFLRSWPGNSFFFVWPNGYGSYCVLIHSLGAYCYMKFHHIRLVLKSMSNTNIKYHENYSRNFWSSCKLHHMSLATIRESNTPGFSSSCRSSISTRLKQLACITLTPWMKISLTPVIDICQGEVHYKRNPDRKNTEGPAHSRSMLTLRHKGPEGNGGEASLN